MLRIAADRIEHDVGVGDALREIGRPIVDHLVRPKLPRNGDSIAVSGGRHSGACVACKLDCETSDATCARMNQDRLAARQTDAFEQRLPGRAGGCGNSSRVVERDRSEEHTSELQSLMRISYAVF